MQVGGIAGKMKLIGFVLDGDGNPKASKEEAIKYWKFINKEHKEFLKNKYSLDLEIK